MKVLNYDKIYNGRDIGGMKTKDGRTIKYGRLYRSGMLSPYSDIDKATLESLHLTDVIDFRESSALTICPDYQMAGVTYHNFPPVNFEASKKGIDDDLMNRVKALGGGEAFMVALYRDMFTTQMAIDAYKDFFKVLLSGDGRVILWHCAQGKDRAGMAAFFTEYALGVPLEDCLNDYLYSKVAMDKFQAYALPAILAHYKDDQLAIDTFKNAYTVKLSYISETLKYLNEHYGSVDNFIVNTLGVDVEKLRALYLE